MKTKQIHIYDVDGTLVDSTHRYRTIIKNGKLAIDFPHWVKNRHTAMHDSLLPLAEQYQAQRRDPEIFTVLATARNMVPQEWQHIQTRLGMPDFLISRANGDQRSGATMKIEGLNKLFNFRPELAALPGYFYEDNRVYLDTVADNFGFTKIFVPSEQGY